MDYAKVYPKIQKRRKELKISQEQIAFDLEIDQSGYSKTERGLRNPGPAILKKIVEYLKIRF